MGRRRRIRLMRAAEQAERHVWDLHIIRAVDLLQATRITLALLMLGGAAILDLRTRRVPNGYWFPFVALAASLVAVDVGLHGAAQATIPLLVAVGLSALLYAAWWSRLFGGADA